MIMIEQKVDFSEFVMEGYGTADWIIVSDDTLQIIDFKYRLGVLVNAERNTQLMCYSDMYPFTGQPVKGYFNEI